MKVFDCLFTYFFSRLFPHLSQEVFVIVMEELTGHVTHFNTIDNAPEFWDQGDIKVNISRNFSKEVMTDLL